MPFELQQRQEHFNQLKFEIEEVRVEIMLAASEIGGDDQPYIFSVHPYFIQQVSGVGHSGFNLDSLEALEYCIERFLETLFEPVVKFI